MELFYSLSKHDLHKRGKIISNSVSLLSFAFTLVEMLMALLIVSVILSASLPVISQRTKAVSENLSKYSPMPVGAIIMWKVDGALPDNSWLEANGQAIPNGIEYEECRRVYGARLPDLRGADNEFYDNLNKYLSKDIKDYLQSAIKPIPQNLVAIWKSDAIPSGWSWDKDFDGYFIRGVGGNSAALMSAQNDAIRNITGLWYAPGAEYVVASGAFYPIRFGETYEHPSGRSGGSNGAYFDASRVVPVANENRPVNKAVKFIKYTNSPIMPDLPEPPEYSQRFRYIVKVRS